MQDARVPELWTGVGVAGPAVESGCVDLGVEVRRPEPAPQRLAFERREERRPDAAAAPAGQHRHAPDLHRPAVEHVKAARPDRHPVVARQGVNGGRVAAVVGVDLFLERHALFADEDLAPDREGQR